MEERRLPREDDLATQNPPNSLPFGLGFIDDLVAVGLKENDEFVVERIQVLFRSVEFPKMPIKGKHDV